MPIRNLALEDKENNQPDTCVPSTSSMLPAQDFQQPGPSMRVIDVSHF